MNQDNKTLTLLQVAVPPSTPLTVPAMIKILEILGIVSSPELISSMQLATSMIPAATPATLFALIKLLGNLIQHHPKATKAHHEALSAVLKNLSGLQDAPMTFGTYLPICEALMKAPPHRLGKA